MLARDAPAAMKTLYLHVGLHKTGTTSIQIALASAAPRLRATGLLYPAAGRPESAPYGHHEIAWSFMERASYLPVDWVSSTARDAATRGALVAAVRDEAEASGCDRVVLSSEEFDCLTAAEIRAFGDAFWDWRVHVILFLRDFADFIESAYKTYLMHSSASLDIVRFAGGQRTRLDAALMVSDWLAVATGGRVFVVDYDDPSIKADSLDAVRTCLDLGADDLPSLPTRQNESVPASLVEFVRFLRAKEMDGTLVEQWVQAVGRNLRFNADSSLLPPDLARELHERYRVGVGAIRALQDARLRLIGAFEPKAWRPVRHISSVGQAIMDLRA